MTKQESIRIGPYVFRGPEFRSTLTVLFGWFFILLIFGVGSVAKHNADSLVTFLIFGATSITIIALIAFISRHSLPGQLALSVLSYTVLCVLPFFTIEFHSQNERVFYDLYIVLLVTLPVFFKIWSWHFHLLAGLVALTTVWVGGIPLSTPGFFGVFVLTTACLLPVVVIYLRHRDSSSGVRERRLERDSLYRQVNTPSRSNVWLVMILQGLILIPYVSFGLTEHLAGGEVTQNWLLALYALLVLLFGGLILTSLKALYVDVGVLTVSLLIGVLLVLGAALSPDTTWVQRSLPILCLVFTTVWFPWAPHFQTAFSWTLGLFVLYSLSVNPYAATPYLPNAWTPEYMALNLESLRTEMLFLFCGLAASVPTAHVLRWVHLGFLISSEVLEKQEDSRKLSSEVGSILMRSRMYTLSTSLFFLGVLSCFMVSMIMTRTPTAPIYLSAGSWVFFLLLWMVILLFQRRSELVQQLWFLGVFLSIVLYAWPALLITNYTPTEPVWALWPACLIIGLGFIPWSIAEIGPILVITSLASAQILDATNLGLAGGVLFFLSIVVGVLFGRQSSLRVRDRIVLSTLADEISDVDDKILIFNLLVEHLRVLLGAQVVVLSRYENDLEVLKGDYGFAVSSDLWPIRSVRGLGQEPQQLDGVASFFLINGLPQELDVLDKRIGAVSIRHTVIVELAARLDPRGVNKSLPPLVAFGFGYPQIFSLRSQELAAAQTLCRVAELRFNAIDNEMSTREQEVLFRQAQVTREYELNTLVHDINNTVQDLTVHCDSIIDGLTEPNEQRSPKELLLQIGRINTIARSMATVVSDAKRKRELERSSDLSPKETVDLTEVLQEIVNYARIRAERKRIKVSLCPLPHERVLVKISAREHLETILRNLFNNATTYSDPGSDISVNLKLDGQSVALDVIDTGPGLSREDLTSIFEAGYRGEAGKVTKGGLGIGLSQSRRVAESAGGTLEAFSDGLGKGSTFRLKLPRQRELVRHFSGSSWALMVDDQPSLTTFYARIAKALDMNPILASSVPEAKNVIMGNGRPEFVLTDLHLGSSNGIDLVKFVRSQFGDALPILVVSAITDEDVIREVRQAGATDFVSKPIGRRALYARIQSLLLGH